MQHPIKAKIGLIHPGMQRLTISADTLVIVCRQCSQLTDLRANRAVWCCIMIQVVTSPLGGTIKASLPSVG